LEHNGCLTQKQINTDRNPRMNRLGIIILLWSVCSVLTFAQPRRPLTKQVYQALNNYVEYSNEIVHALQVMYDDFEYLNGTFNDYVEQKQDSIAYKAERLFNNYDFFPVLPRDLYQRIFDQNNQIAFELRGKPLKFVGQIKNVSAEIEEIRQKIEDYIQSEEYRNDKNLAKGYDWLRRIEVLYYDIYALQEKLHWNLTAILNSYEREVKNEHYYRVLTQLKPLVEQSKRLLRAVRAKDVSAGLAADCVKMKDLLFKLRRSQVEILWSIPEDERTIYRNYSLMLDRGEKLMNHTLTYLNEPNKHYQDMLRAPYYYFYNYDMLDNYNRYGDGLAVLYNKMVKYSNEECLWADELPPVFETVYPQHPAFDSLRRDSMPDPDWFLAQLEKMRQDSLRKIDSLNNLVKVDTPKVGEPSLNGFATNNLIFLIDISSSMGEPNKLPLLKESLDQFLDLMRKEDNVTVIVYSQKVEMLLSPTSAAEKGKIMEVLQDLEEQSSSNADRGLEVAYLVAKESFIEDGNNRIILSTDGNFKLKRKTQRLIRKRAKQEIKLSVFYFSEQEFKSVQDNLQKISNWGQGSYHYITKDNAEEALLIEAQSVRKGNTAQ
jgi:Ca-activated chloride channel family protein